MYIAFGTDWISLMTRSRGGPPYIFALTICAKRTAEPLGLRPKKYWQGVKAPLPAHCGVLQSLLYTTGYKYVCHS